VLMVRCEILHRLLFKQYYAGFVESPFAFNKLESLLHLSGASNGKS
jgi:hypothetical protein